MKDTRYQCFISSIIEYKFIFRDQSTIRRTIDPMPSKFGFSKIHFPGELTSTVGYSGSELAERVLSLLDLELLNSSRTFSFPALVLVDVEKSSSVVEVELFVISLLGAS